MNVHELKISKIPGFEGNKFIFKNIKFLKEEKFIKKGAKEVYKSCIRNEIKLIILSSDVNPKSVVQPIIDICTKKNIPILKVSDNNIIGVLIGEDFRCTVCGITGCPEALSVELEREISKLKRINENNNGKSS